jgi:hypothetical protein
MAWNLRVPGLRQIFNTARVFPPGGFDVCYGLPRILLSAI